MEAAAVLCTLGEISCTLEKRWRRRVPSSSVVSGLYIASFCGSRGGGRNKGGEKNRDDNNDDDYHDDEEDKEEEEEREYRSVRRFVY